jgi:exosome complex exonuclease RRP6
MEEQQKHLFRAVHAVVKSMQQFPTEDDFVYASVDRAFVQGRAGYASRVMALTSAVMKSVRPNLEVPLASTDEASEVYDTLTEVSDHLLDKVNSFVDDRKGLRTAIDTAYRTANSLATMSQRAHHKKNTLWESSAVISKPQLMFEDTVDNSNTPWKPPPVQKYHEVQNPSAASIVSSTHPFAHEIAGLMYDASQLSSCTPTPPVDIKVCPFVFVDTPQEFENVCLHSPLFPHPPPQFVAHVESAAELAIDLEHHSHRSFQGFTCLMQVSTRQRDYVIDAIALRSSMHVRPFSGPYSYVAAPSPRLFKPPRRQSPSRCGLGH